MKHAAADIARIEDINDATVRLHFTDGLTMQMSRKAYESGNWQNGTHKGLIVNLA
jgi:hypothetical protein